MLASGGPLRGVAIAPAAAARGIATDPRGADRAVAGPAASADAPAAFGGLDRTAMLAGPIWAAARGAWTVFAITAVAELVALVLLGRQLWPAAEAAGPPRLWPALLLLAADRSALGLVAARITAGAAWRERDGLASARRRAVRRAVVGGLLLVFFYGLVLHRFVAAEPWAPLAKFPAQPAFFTVTAKALDAWVKWLVVEFEPFFRSVTIVLRTTLNAVELVFVQTPWPAVGLFWLLVTWRVAGWRALAFTAAALAYIGLFGYWEKSMATMALVAASVVICIGLGVPMGVLCAKSRRLDALAAPALDMMQTLPTFVYLIPAVAFFSIGKPPGVVATVIFALPPMIRLTALGIRQVPEAAREAALAFGAGPWQLLVKVELPLATPSIKLGINQAIMMSLSMVVIAAMIGAGGLGQDIIRALTYLQTGQGILAGMAIVLCAMVLDRLVRVRGRPGGWP